MANSIQKLIELRKAQVIHSDFRKDLDLNPVTEDLAALQDEAAIKESLKNLVLTDKGERLMRPEFGGNIRATLFDLNTPATITVLKEQVREVIENYEPRVTLIDLVVKSDYDSNQIEVGIHFYILNKEEALSTTILLERIR